MNYRHDIDGLRAVAIISVVFFHAGLGFPGGFVGVDVFFVISGFLITNLIVREIAEKNFSLLDFWERRARRILPALTLVTAVSLIAGWFFLLPQDYRNLAGHVIALVALSTNIQFWRETGYFAADSEEKPLLHTWSLSVEEQFYVIIPVCLVLLHKSRKWNSASLVLSFFVAGSFIFSICLVSSCPTAAFYLLPSRAWELGVGSLLAFSKPITSPFKKKALAWLGLCLVLIPCFFYSSSTPFPGIFAVPPVVGSAFLIWTGTKADVASTMVHKILSSAPLVWVGLLSYSLYLWHWPLFALSKYVLNCAPPLIIRISLMLASILLAWLSLVYIERPFRSKALIARRSVIFALGGVVALVLAIPSFIIWHGKGVPNRLSPVVQSLSSARNDYNFVKELRQCDIPSGLIPLGTPNGHTKIVVWGDSSAMAILPVVDHVCNEAGISALAATRSSTPPVLNWFIDDSKYGLNEKSPTYNKAVLEHIISLSKDKLKYVVLAARWQSYMQSKNCSGFDRALADTISKIESSGVRVVILKEVPTFPVNVPKSLALEAMLGWDFLRPKLSKHSHEIATRGQNELFSKLHVQFKKIYFIDPAPLLIDEDEMITSSNANVSYYRDQYHLSIQGSMLLTNELKVLTLE